MLKFDKVSKEFKDGNQMIEAVDIFNLDKGELVAIVGPSGSGKSTFPMAGADANTRRKYTLMIIEFHIESEATAKMRMQEIGFYFTIHELSTFLTIKQQFHLLKNIKRRVSTEEFDKLLNDLGLKEIENKLPSEISGGQKQRRNC